MPRLLLIAGPTASGKSALAIEVARALDGVVINADAMQLYAELPILTAQPSAAEQALAPHRLFGVLRATDPCSAARWCRLVAGEIKRLSDRLAIIVGGTGLYMDALRNGLAEIPDVPPEVRAAAVALHAELGAEAFHAALAARDPESAARLPPGDTQRLIRAWEVLEATGRPLSAWIADPRVPPPADWRIRTLALMPDRRELYPAIDRRLLGMIEAGALAEVERVADLDKSLPLMKAVAAPELLRALHGEIPLAEAISLAQQASRRYAKRQMTWARHRLHPDTWHYKQYSVADWPELFPIIRELC